MHGLVNDDNTPTHRVHRLWNGLCIPAGKRRSLVVETLLDDSFQRGCGDGLGSFVDGMLLAPTRSDFHLHRTEGGSLKPSTVRTLTVLRQNPDGATTHDLLEGGAGSRYGARLKELRDEGCEIPGREIRPGSWIYRLIVDPLPPISELVAPSSAGLAKAPKQPCLGVGAPGRQTTYEQLSLVAA